MRFRLCPGQRRLVCAHDPQPGRATGARLPCPRHHDAIHGQIGLAHQRQRRDFHYGDIEKRQMVSPISMLGDLLPVMAGVSLGARMQGKELACLTWIGDGGQSTGVSYEGINFAAVRKLGLVLIMESNLWAYSTPTEYQVNVKDLANRAIGYGMPGVIIDGTDACQVYDATYEAVQRAHRGEPDLDRSQTDAHERPCYS